MGTARAARRHAVPGLAWVLRGEGHAGAFLKSFGRKRLLPLKILEQAVCGLGRRWAVASLLEDRVSQSGLGTGRVPSEAGVSKSPCVHGGVHTWGCVGAAGGPRGWLEPCVYVCGASPPGLGPSAGAALPRGPGQVHIPTPSLPGSEGS